MLAYRGIVVNPSESRDTGCRQRHPQRRPDQTSHHLRQEMWCRIEVWRRYDGNRFENISEKKLWRWPVFTKSRLLQCVQRKWKNQNFVSYQQFFWRYFYIARQILPFCYWDRKWVANLRVFRERWQDFWEAKRVLGWRGEEYKWWINHSSSDERNAEW